jgi:hypothetical protein
MAAADAAAGAGGLLGALGGFNLSMYDTTCQASCAASQMQECAMDSECPPGQTCNAPAGMGGGAGAGAGLMLPSICGAPRPDAGMAAAPDAGTTPVVDSGSPAVDSGAVDANTAE